MAQLAFFVGTFACDGESRATPLMGPHPIKRTITGRMDLDGFWLFMRLTTRRRSRIETPIRGNWQLIYDHKAANFVAVWTDNLGRWFPQTSRGWAGDTIAFTGDFLLNDKKAEVQDMFYEDGRQRDENDRAARDRRPLGASAGSHVPQVRDASWPAPLRCLTLSCGVSGRKIRSRTMLALPLCAATAAFPPATT